MSGCRFHPDVASRRDLTAFTLVELLVVIGIVAVLIAVLLPVLGRARAAANRTVCLSYIRQLGIGVLMYCNDNEGWFPTCAYPDDGVGFKPYHGDWVHWQANRNLEDSAIARYVGRGEQLKNTLRCPVDVIEGHRVLPALVPGQGPYLYSYSLNAAVGENDSSGKPVRTKISQWRSPARRILITEGWERYPTAGWIYVVQLTRRHGTARFRGNVPGDPGLSRGSNVGANVSAAVSWMVTRRASISMFPMT